MTTRTNERAALAMIAALAGACSTEVKENAVNQAVSDGSAVANCSPPLLPDAGNGAMYECSSDVTRPTHWAKTRGMCGEPWQPGCPWQFGCESFDVGREAVCAYHTGSGPPFEAREQGLLVIGDSTLFTVIRVYYDETTRKMVGYRHGDDVGETVCAGRVPEWGQETDVVRLCSEHGGAHFDAGGAEPSIDAGDSG